MIRIAFLGCDSTHTEAFGRRIHDPGGPFSSLARVVSIYDKDAQQARSKAAALGIERVESSVIDALAGVDLAMVIGRFGDSHFGPASQALRSGIPTFVDKPFTTDVVQAKALIDLAQSNRVPLASSSPLRFAAELLAMKRRLADGGEDWLRVAASAPATCTDLGDDPRLESAFFYGIHAIEMLLEVVGPIVTDVRVLYGDTAITTHMKSPDGRTAVLELVRGAPEFYRLSVCTATREESAVVELDGGYYGGLLEFVLGDFINGRPRVPIESTRHAIEILAMIEEGDPVRIARLSR